MKTIIRGNRVYDLHSEIFSALEREVEGLKVTCVGGGKISIDPKNKQLKLFGHSTNYGKEKNRQRTANILKKTYPDFDIRWE